MVYSCVLPAAKRAWVDVAVVGVKGPIGETGSRWRAARRAMTAPAIDNVLAWFGHGTHAGRPPIILNLGVLAPAGTSTYP